MSSSFLKMRIDQMMTQSQPIQIIHKSIRQSSLVSQPSLVKNRFSPSMLRKKNVDTVFVEPSPRVKSILNFNEIRHSRKGICFQKEIKTLSIQYSKSIMYYAYNDAPSTHNIIVIDDTFRDMFATAFVEIVNLPTTFIGNLDDYTTVVYLLHKQLEWTYEEEGYFLAKFRKDIYNSIANLSSMHFVS